MPLPWRSGSSNLCVPIQRCDRQLARVGRRQLAGSAARFAQLELWSQCWRWMEAGPALKKSLRAVAGVVPSG